MHILLFAKVVKDKHIPHILELFSVLSEHKAKLYFTTELHELFSKNHSISTDMILDTHEDLARTPLDYVITLGGDGTILAATTIIKKLEIPLLGINLGRLGFLAGVEKHYSLEAITHLMNGNYRVDARTMLYLETNHPLFEGKRFALNDFTLHKRDTSSMITIKTYINGEHLNSYWCDGIIVATPTGSTAYSLSCGGPIIFPGSGNFVITPVAPHNLNVRPIVISDTSVISFEIEGRSENFLCTLDSRFETINMSHQLAVRRCEFKTNLILIDDHTFLRTLRNKISWGQDNRN